VGQSCVKELFAWSTGAGLNFFKSEKNVYKFIMSRVNNGVLYLTVNDTDMVLSEDPRGYVICQTVEANNDYAKILKGKYFDHLSSVYIEILDTWIRKTESLESVFMELLGRSMLEDIHAVKVSDVCSEIRKQV
jgi:hypothetical protein